MVSLYSLDLRVATTLNYISHYGICGIAAATLKNETPIQEVSWSLDHWGINIPTLCTHLVIWVYIPTLNQPNILHVDVFVCSLIMSILLLLTKLIVHAWSCALECMYQPCVNIWEVAKSGLSQCTCSQHYMSFEKSKSWCCVSAVLLINRPKFCMKMICMCIGLC